MSAQKNYIIQETAPYLHERTRNFSSKIKKENIKRRSVSSAKSPLADMTRYALCVLLIFTPLARASVQGWAICVIHIVTLTALTPFLLDMNLTGKWRWIRTSLDKPILALLVLAVLSAVFSTHRHTSFRALTLLVNYIVVFYLIIHTIRSRTQFRQLVCIIIGMAVFISVFGFLKMSGISPFPWWNYTDLSQNTLRLTSVFGNPDHLAGYMEMALPLILGLFLKDYKGGKLLLMTYLTIIMLTALILSLSRGGWIGSLTSLVFMSVMLLRSRHFKHKKILISLIVGLLAVALIVLFNTPVVKRFRTIVEQEEMSINSRITAWKGVVKMVNNHPLTGIGPGNFGTVFTQYQPPGLGKHFRMAHNDYLHFISELGIFFIPVLIWMMIAFYRRGFRKLKSRSRQTRGIALGAMSGVTAILVHSMADFNLHIPSNALLFTILVAMVAAPRKTKCNV